MRKLLTGHVVNYNRRHKRCGHLFQNRYKAILCEDDPCLLELTRYIPLNPLKAGIVKDFNGLSTYERSGHSAIMGIINRPWQDCNTILGHFGADGARVSGHHHIGGESFSTVSQKFCCDKWQDNILIYG